MYSTPKEMKELTASLDKLHTTELGAMRIKRNLNLETDDVVDWCRQKIQNAENITNKGKNWYVHTENTAFTVNANSCRNRLLRKSSCPN